MGTYESRIAPRCTGPAASVASPSAPSLTTMISGDGRPRSVSAAKRSARGKSADASVTFTAATAASSSLTSPVSVESGVAAASICATSMRSLPERPRTIAFTRSFAAARRLGATSVACMLALASTSTTMLRPSTRFTAGRGSPSAKSKSAIIASWSRSESRRFSCEKRLVVSLSSRMRSQMRENGTATGLRRSFKMYRTTTAMPAAAPICSSVWSGSP